MECKTNIKVMMETTDDGSVLLSSHFGDIITLGDSKEKAIQLFIDDIKIYVIEYLNNITVYSSSKNRAKDLPIILELKNCKNDVEILHLLYIYLR